MVATLPRFLEKSGLLRLHGDAFEEEDEYRNIFVCRDRKIDVPDVDSLKCVPRAQTAGTLTGLRELGTHTYLHLKIVFDMLLEIKTSKNS